MCVCVCACACACVCVLLYARFIIRLNKLFSDSTQKKTLATAYRKRIETIRVTGMKQNPQHYCEKPIRV